MDLLPQTRNSEYPSLSTSSLLSDELHSLPGTISSELGGRFRQSLVVAGGLTVGGLEQAPEEIVHHPLETAGKAAICFATGKILHMAMASGNPKLKLAAIAIGGGGALVSTAATVIHYGNDVQLQSALDQTYRSASPGMLADSFKIGKSRLGREGFDLMLAAATGVGGFKNRTTFVKPEPLVPCLAGPVSETGALITATDSVLPETLMMKGVPGGDFLSTKIGHGQTLFYKPGLGGKELLESIIVRDYSGDHFKHPAVKRILASPLMSEIAAEIPTGSAPIGLGQCRLAFRLENGNVLCIGPAIPRPCCPVLLQANQTKTFGGIQCETMPYAETSNITDADLSFLRAELKSAGWYCMDWKTENFGVMPNGRRVVIDPNAVAKWRWDDTDHALAVPVYRQAIESAIAQFGIGSRFEAGLRKQLADHLQGIEQYAEASDHYIQALDILTKLEVWNEAQAVASDLFYLNRHLSEYATIPHYCAQATKYGSLASELQMKYYKSQYSK